MTIHSKVSWHGKRILATLVSLFVVAAVATYSAGATSAAESQRGTGSQQRAFDWEIGKWRTSVQVLAEPLSDTEDVWLKFDGTSVVKPLMDGNANVVELRLTGTAGTVKALNFRLFEPGAQRWSSTFANLRDGMLTPSVYGTFDGRVGTFYGDDQLDGKAIKVRFIVERQGPNRAKFTQAFPPTEAPPGRRTGSRSTGEGEACWGGGSGGRGARLSARPAPPRGLAKVTRTH